MKCGLPAQPVRSGVMLRVEIARLSHKDIRQQRRAVRKLFELDDPDALVAFTELLDSDDQWFRDKAVEAIRRWANTDDIDLARSLAASNSSEQRMLATEVSPRMGIGGLSLLESMCSDQTTQVRSAAWKSRFSMLSTGMGVTADDLDAALSDIDHGIRRMAVMQLADISEGDIGVRLSVALTDSHSRVRKAALEVLTEQPGLADDSSVTKALSIMVDDSNADISSQAATFLLEPEVAAGDFDRIKQLAVDPNPQMRNAIVTALAEIGWVGDSTVVDTLRASLDATLLVRLLRRPHSDHERALRLELLNDDGYSEQARARLLENMHGRPLTEDEVASTKNLCDDGSDLISQAASSLLADHAELQD